MSTCSSPQRRPGPHTGCNARARPNHPVRLLVALSLWTCCASSAQGSTDERSERVLSAVRDLASPLRATRAAAERTLLELGPDVLDDLPPPDLVDDPAARDTLRRIRTELELRAARDSLQPARVSLAGPMTVLQAAAEISQQSGNPVLTDRVPEATAARRIELNCDRVPFWEALRQLLNATELDWAMIPDPPAVALVPAAEAVPVVARAASGAFLVELESLTAKGHTIRAQFRLAAEPRLRPLFLQIADADFVALVGGRPLALFSPDARTDLPMTTRVPATFAVLFQRPAKQDDLLPLTIRGKLTAETAAAPREVRFRGMEGPFPVARRRGGVTVSLLRSRYFTAPDGGRHALVRLSIVYDTGGPAFESHRTWIYHNEVYLQAEDGRRFAVNDGFETIAETGGGVGLEYRFKDLPDLAPSAWELVYVAPTLLIDAPVEFEFERVTLTAHQEKGSH